MVTSVDSLVDGANQTWEIDGDRNTQSDSCSPIHAALVSVDTFVLVKHRNVELPVSNKEVIGDLHPLALLFRGIVSSPR